MKYALMFDGTEHNDILVGTAAGVAREYCRICGEELHLCRDDEGRLCYAIRLDPEDGEDGWDIYDYIEDRGTVKANLDAAYEGYLKDFLLEDTESDYVIFRLFSKMQEEVFQWSFDQLLDHITAREVRDEHLSLEDEFWLRCWFFTKKVEG